MLTSLGPLPFPFCVVLHEPFELIERAPGRGHGWVAEPEGEELPGDLL